MKNEIAHQIELARFPVDIDITCHEVAGGMILRAAQPGHAAELLLTDEAARMYGEGPAVTLALTKLKHAIAQGLPALGNDGEVTRMVFLGD